jgi:hypothetical protein
VAEAASLHSDAATVHAALDRATLARRSGVETPAWMQQTVDIVARQTEDDRGPLAMLLLSAHSSPAMGPARLLMRHCKPGALDDERRRGQCERLAEQVLDLHADPFERSIAIDLGSQLGWPADRIATLRSENEVLFALETQFHGAPTGMPEPEGCGYWQRELDRRLRGMAIGEVAAAREQVTATGLSPQQLVARYQARLRALGIDRTPLAGASAASASASGTTLPP